jgi:hypothetical protein
MFSLNILNGGVMDTMGTCDCPNTGGKGTMTSPCRMTSEQGRSYGQTIGPFGCAMLMEAAPSGFESRPRHWTYGPGVLHRPGRIPGHDVFARYRNVAGKPQSLFLRT